LPQSAALRGKLQETVYNPFSFVLSRLLNPINYEEILCLKKEALPGVDSKGTSKAEKEWGRRRFGSQRRTGKWSIFDLKSFAGQGN
jgi:hypothetical protein